MKSLLLSLFILSQITSLVATAEDSDLVPAEPILQARDCVLQIVSERMGIQLKSEIAKPQIRPQSSTSLQDFQDSIEGFWGFRPDAFTNVYNPLRNEIFLMTERAYYEKHDRSVYDSFAHELVHYLQKEYLNADFSQGDDFLEMDAVYYQTWFRETYQFNIVNDDFVCPF